jgi:hypothetical protein
VQECFFVVNMRKLIFFACFSLIVIQQVISQDHRYSYNEIVEPDMIRNLYLRVEKALWDNVVSDDLKTKEDKLKSIFTEHNNFVNSHLKDHLDDEDLKMLLNFYGWQKFQSDVINIDRMFVSFQQHLNRETKYIEKGQFNDEVSIDLIEHVLDDRKWPLTEAIENLFKIIVDDSLFAADISVSCFSVYQKF